jgi:hypothetical protein
MASLELQHKREQRKLKNIGLECCDLNAVCGLCDSKIEQYAYAIIHRNVDSDRNTTYFIYCMCSDCYVGHMNHRHNIDGTSEYGNRHITCPHCNENVDSSDTIVAVLPLDCAHEQEIHLKRILAVTIAEEDSRLMGNIHERIVMGMRE